MDVGAGASRAVHIRLLTVWDGAGSEKRKIVGYRLGLEMDRLSELPYSKEYENSNFKPGLPGCYEGKCQGRR